jgi:hypothetical protein
MRSPCCLSAPPFLKAGTEEPEETAVTISYIYVTCDTTPENRNRAVKEAPRRRPLVGNG